MNFEEQPLMQVKQMAVKYSNFILLPVMVMNKMFDG